MAAPETISITLPPELLIQAQSIAEREHRTLSEVTCEALRQYSTRTLPAEWEELFRYGRERGQAMGIESEEDVDRILGEFRTPANRL